MINLGLSAADQLKLVDALTSDHRIRVVISLLDLNEKPLTPLTNYLYDGQVTISADAEITRSASLVLFDPDRVLSFDTNNPADGALYFDKMVSITYCVWKWGWTKSIDIPIFRGPLTKFKRTGMFISAEAYGKEILSLGAAWNPLTYAVGENRVETVRDILASGTGETKFGLQTGPAKLPHAVSLVRESIPWNSAKSLAAGMNMQLFYDGRGTCRMRWLPTATAWTFRNGDGGSILSQPDIDYNLDNAKNVILVKGGTPVGSSTQIMQWAFAPPDHPLSPAKLGRGGKKRNLLEVVTDSTLTSNADALARAKTILADRLQQALILQMSTLPVVHLEENDMAQVTMKDQYSLTFRAKEMAIPLVPDSAATVGTRRMLTLKRRK